MDNNRNSKQEGRLKPRGFVGNFPPPQVPKRFDLPIQDNLPPGTVPNQFGSNIFPPVSQGQFNPYGGRMNNSPNIQRAAARMPNPMSGGSSPLDASYFKESSSPMSTSVSADSGKLMSTSSSSTSIGTPSRMTPEHIISQESVGKLKIDTLGEAFEFAASDLKDCGEIGRGAFGAVNRMIHCRSSTEMAVKRIRSTVDEREQKQLLMDLDVVMRSSDCPLIVKFYGALFWEGDCWICMELMATSLDNFYRFVYHRLATRIPEEILGKIAAATVKALDYLKEKLQIMHRDVKPSNILIDRGGNIKLCDFGISGHLVNSIAKTRDAGCRPYMAPERIDTSRSNGYDVRSDIWSLGITLIELSTGKFPYPKWNNVFDQLTQVVKGEPPKLRNGYNGFTFSDGYIGFVNMLTISDPEQRPKYGQLLATTYLRDMAGRYVDVATYFCTVLDKMTEADFRSEPVGDDGFRS